MSPLVNLAKKTKLVIHLYVPYCLAWPRPWWGGWWSSWESPGCWRRCCCCRPAAAGPCSWPGSRWDAPGSGCSSPAPWRGWRRASWTCRAPWRRRRPAGTAPGHPSEEEKTTFLGMRNWAQSDDQDRNRWARLGASELRSDQKYGGAGTIRCYFLLITPGVRWSGLSPRKLKVGTINTVHNLYITYTV